MIIDESEVEIKKFKMFAEKADSEQKIVELCKKYLKHKGIDTDAIENRILLESLRPKEPQRIYVGKPDIHTVNSRFTVDGFDMSVTQSSDQMIYARKCILENITMEMFKSDLIEFETFKKMDTYQTIINGRVHVWKDPTRK